MDGGPFGAPPVVGQSLSPARAAELSEDGEIFDSDDDDGDLPTLRQILGSPKQVIEVISPVTVMAVVRATTEAKNGSRKGVWLW
jgi:hypothetical protein